MLEKTQIEELKQFCAQPSVSAENRGMLETVELVKQKLLELDVDVQQFTIKNSYPFLLAELKAKTNSESKKTVLIYNHYDVQPEDPVELWETPPFEPTIKDNKLFVRGVSDNKANLLLRVQALRDLFQNDGDLPVNIKWIIEGEEEIGSPHLHDLQQQYGDFWKDCDVCVWETGGVNEAGNPYIKLGMKGVLYIELSCEFNKFDMHSGEAAIIDSPVWRLIHALATLRDVNGNVTVDGLYENTLQPTDQEIDLMENSAFNAREYLQATGSDRPLAEVGDRLEFQKQMYFTHTANICGIWAGYTKSQGIKTILPNKATAKVDFRLAPNTTLKEVEEKLRAHLDKKSFDDIKINTLTGEDFGKSKIENPYIQKCLGVFREVYKKEPEVTIITLGSGPIHYISGVYGIPVVQIGCGYPGCNAHAPNENIRLDDYFSGMVAFEQYLKSL